MLMDPGHVSKKITTLTEYGVFTPSQNVRSEVTANHGKYVQSDCHLPPYFHWHFPTPTIRGHRFVRGGDCTFMKIKSQIGGSCRTCISVEEKSCIHTWYVQIIHSGGVCEPGNEPLPIVLS